MLSPRGETGLCWPTLCCVTVAAPWDLPGKWLAGEQRRAISASRVYGKKMRLRLPSAVIYGYQDGVGVKLGIPGGGVEQNEDLKVKDVVSTCWGFGMRLSRAPFCYA